MKYLFFCATMIVVSFCNAQGNHFWKSQSDNTPIQVIVNASETKAAVFTGDYLTTYDLATGEKMTVHNFVYDDVVKFVNGEHITSFAEDFSVIIISNENNSFWSLNTVKNKFELPAQYNKKNAFSGLDYDGNPIQYKKSDKSLYINYTSSEFEIDSKVGNYKDLIVKPSGLYSVYTKEDDRNIYIFNHKTQKTSKFPEKDFILDLAENINLNNGNYIYATKGDTYAIYDIENETFEKHKTALVNSKVPEKFKNCISSNSISANSFKTKNYYFSVEVDAVLNNSKPSGVEQTPYKLVQYNVSNCEKKSEIRFSLPLEDFQKRYKKVQDLIIAKEAKEQAEIAKEQEQIDAKAPIFKFPELNNFGWGLGQDGKYLAINSEEGKQIAIWNLETMEQVYNFIKPVSKDGIYYWHFDFEEDRDNALIIGMQRGASSGVYSMVDKNKHLDGNTNIPNDRGYVSYVNDREVGMVISRYEKDKKGRLDFDKPLWAQYQFMNIDTKQWHSKRFPEAKSLELIPGQKILLVKYKKKYELYKYKDVTFSNLQKIDEVKTDYQDVKFDLQKQDHIYFVRKTKSGRPDKVLAYNINTKQSHNLGPEIARSLNYENNVSHYVPEIIDVVSDGFKAKKLVVTNLKDNSKSEVFLTAQTTAEKEDLEAQIKSYHENDIESQIELEAKNLKELERRKNINFFFNNFDFVGTGKSYSLDKLRGRELNSIPIANEILGQTWGQKAAIGKIKDCGFTWMLFYVINDPNNTDIRVAKVSKGGGQLMGKKHLLSVPMVNGQIAAKTSFTFFNTTKGVRFDYTKTDLRTGKSASGQIDCGCDTSW